MAWFEKPRIKLRPNDVIAIFTAYNEAERIPYFLSYYRALGVDHFLAIDNNSSDNTRELLSAQPDVTYFHTTCSYVESKAGRLWTSELAAHYGMGRWCLTLDLDEQLVYPGSEYLNLKSVCKYLDRHGYEGIFTVFLDMYSSASLADAVYMPGQPFLDVCSYFEVDGYTLRRPKYFPEVNVFGGPRQRMFFNDGRSGSGPAMRKLPLIKWSPGFEYIFSTHSCTPIRLADFTGALLHFKFFSSFKNLAERELARGDRVQKAHYENYARLTREQNVSFHKPYSIRYEDSSTLVQAGVMVCTRKFLNETLADVRQETGGGLARFLDERLRAVMDVAEERATLPLAALPAVWPILKNDFGQAEVAKRSVGNAAGGPALAGQLMAIFEGKAYGWACDMNSPDRIVDVEVTNNGRTIRAPANINHALLQGVPEGARTHGFSIPLERDSFLSLSPATGKISVKIAGSTLVLVGEQTINVTGNGFNAQFEGYCDGGDAGLVQGWVRRRNDPHLVVEVAVFIDGQFLARVRADRARADLAEQGVGHGRYGFVVNIPRLFRTDHRDHRIDVVVAASGEQLRRSPMTSLEDVVRPSATKPKGSKRLRDALLKR